MYEDIYNQIKLAAEKKNLKPSTANAYCHTIRHFLDYTGKPWDELIIDDADAFLTAKRLSGVMPETYNHYYSAIRFMYKRILKLYWDEDKIARMKRDRALPVVLSKDEINSILDATKNLKHKAMIATMYSGGLRVSEVVHLHYDDISRSNKSIHIRNTKTEETDILFLPTVHWIYLQNTGFNAVNQGIYCFQVNGLTITLIFQV